MNLRLQLTDSLHTATRAAIHCSITCPGLTGDPWSRRSGGTLWLALPPSFDDAGRRTPVAVLRIPVVALLRPLAPAVAAERDGTAALAAAPNCRRLTIRGTGVPCRAVLAPMVADLPAVRDAVAAVGLHAGGATRVNAGVRVPRPVVTFFLRHHDVVATHRTAETDGGRTG